MAIVEQHMPGIGQLRLAADPLAGQSGIGIGRRLMGVIAVRFPVEIDRRILRSVRRRRPLVFATEVLEAGPGFQQGAVHREVFDGQQAAVRACATTASKKAAAMSLANRRSRFLLNVVGDQIASSISSPTNHRNSTL
jgi:hypothetical protein